jgi:hypothetical protein
MQHSYRTVVVERHRAGYAVLMLNRPEKLNALSMELRAELVAAIEELRRDPAVRVLIVTGAGRAFCSGLDLNELSKAESNSAQAFALDVVAALLKFEGPVIGAINGVAATGGFEIAMACDILIASTDAQFADTHAKVGLLPGFRGLARRVAVAAIADRPATDVSDSGRASRRARRRSCRARIPAGRASSAPAGAPARAVRSPAEFCRRRSPDGGRDRKAPARGSRFSGRPPPHNRSARASRWALRNGSALRLPAGAGAATAGARRARLRIRRP